MSCLLVSVTCSAARRALSLPLPPHRCFLPRVTAWHHTPFVRVSLGFPLRGPRSNAGADGSRQRTHTACQSAWDRNRKSRVVCRTVLHRPPDRPARRHTVHPNPEARAGHNVTGTSGRPPRQERRRIIRCILPVAGLNLSLFAANSDKPSGTRPRASGFDNGCASNFPTPVRDRESGWHDYVPARTEAVTASSAVRVRALRPSDHRREARASRGLSHTGEHRLYPPAFTSCGVSHAA